MMQLKNHKNLYRSFSDMLNYGHLIDDGVILNKDLAFLCTYVFKAPDINSATTEELDAITQLFNRALLKLEDGWMISTDTIRLPAKDYPEPVHFPNLVAEIIDEERRLLYQKEGLHYENQQFLSFVWKCPQPKIKTARHFFIAGEEQNKDKHQELTQLYESFKRMVNSFVDLLKDRFYFELLNSESLLTFLHFCISGEWRKVTVPPLGSYLDVALSTKEVMGGFQPKIGDHNISVLSLLGYRNKETLPGLLEELAAFPMVYRVSDRFIPLSSESTAKELRRYEVLWSNKIKGLVGVIKEAIFRRPITNLNRDAIRMHEEVQQAKTINSDQSTRFGYWTSEVIIYWLEENKQQVEEAIKEISRYVQNIGFDVREESMNSFDAYLGSIPGHGACNMRQVFLTGYNLAHIMPLHSIYAGKEELSSQSLLPKGSPPTFFAATTGNTPYRFCLDVSDLGHALIIGPTGAGKSTLLQFLVAQFLRYPNARVFIFDKDYSHLAFTKALSGQYYSFEDENLSLSPFHDLSTTEKRQQAKIYVEMLIELQGVTANPEIRSAISKAIDSLATSKNKSMSMLQGTVQHREVKAALEYYTKNGTLKTIDSEIDMLKGSHLCTFDMTTLLNLGESFYMPILVYLFNFIENSLDGAKQEGTYETPTLIVIEEAWKFFAHPFFAPKLRDWLKILRKKNARLVSATQSLTDLYDPATKSLTQITANLMESCPTKIFLPNLSMDVTTKEMYRLIPLNDRQIEIISLEAIPKQHYYVVNPEGNRLIDLGLRVKESMALSFIGLSQQKTKEYLTLDKEYGDLAPYHWLIKEGFNDWAQYFMEQYNARLM